MLGIMALKIFDVFPDFLAAKRAKSIFFFSFFPESQNLETNHSSASAQVKVSLNTISLSSIFNVLVCFSENV